MITAVFFTLGGIATGARGEQTSSFTVDVVYTGSGLDGLVRTSPVILDVSVESVWPATEIRPGQLATDAVLNVNRVVKGPDPGPRIVVSQLGGALDGRVQTSEQFSLMQPGERYILFLEPFVIPDNLTPRQRAGMPQFPIREFLPRFEIIGTFHGMFQVREGHIATPEGTVRALREAHDGQDASQFLQQVDEVVGSNDDRMFAQFDNQPFSTQENPSEAES